MTPSSRLISSCTSSLALAAAVLALAVTWAPRPAAQSGSLYIDRMSTTGAAIFGNTAEGTWPTGSNTFFDAAETGPARSLFLMRAQVPHWEVRMAGDATGSGLTIRPYSDAGADYGASLACDRDAGRDCAFGGDVAVQDLAVNDGDVTSDDATVNLFAATVTALNVGSSGTTVAVPGLVQTPKITASADLELDPTGNDILPVTDDDLTLGAATKRFAKAFLRALRLDNLTSTSSDYDVVVLDSNGDAYKRAWPSGAASPDGVSETTSDATNSSGGWESDGPASASLAANSTYQFMATIVWTGGYGFGPVLPEFAVTGPTSPTFVSYRVTALAEISGGEVRPYERWCTAYDCTTATVTAYEGSEPDDVISLSTEYLALITGTIRTGANTGALTVRSKQVSGTITIKARSSLVTTKVG